MGRKADLLRVARFVEQGKLKPVVDRVMPLREARAAHEALEKREAFGKIVLSVD
jgi:NADPH:quinone reductase-like Zn-dependent oxidoreductase